VFYGALDDRVCLIKLIPGMTARSLLRCAEGCRAVIIESFGCGGIPHGGGFADGIAALVQSGVHVIVTTQVPHEGSDLSVYRVGMHIRREGVLEAYDMTLEAVFAKVMWALAVADGEYTAFRRIFETPVCKDRV
jgi:L-asparaginase